ncbi:MAG: DUF3048 domain-containing protein [Pontimonas sp.]
MNTAKVFVAGAVALSFALAGCGASSEEALDVGESEVAGESTTDTGGDVTVDANLWPLTGTALDGGDPSAPSLAAKIDNHPLARPQVGLDRADIVFEELVEGGITRYVAIWHSDVPAEIGPVRSVRPMDPEIVSPFGGILAYSGGQQRFIEAMLDAPVASAIHGQSDVDDFFYRSSNAVAPHNVIVRAPELIANFADRSAPSPQFNYATSVADSTAALFGDDLSNIRVTFSSFSSPSWEWSADDGVFYRNQTNGAADLAISGDQIAADNVIVLEVDIQVIQDIPTTNLIDSGEGFVATGGKIHDIRWSKESAESPIELSDASGARVLLAPGQTWIELIPAEGSGVPTGVITIQ